MNDLRLAVRSMLRRPLMSVASVLALAPALAAAGLGLALVWSILLRPLPHPDAERLAVVEHTWNTFGVTGISGPLYEFYRAQSRTVERLGLVAWTQMNLAVGVGEPRRTSAVRVTASTLELLGARPALGRLFTPRDDDTGAPRVVVLTHELWRQAFGGRTDVVGTSVHVDGYTASIVGVLSPDVEFPGGDPRLVLTAGLDATQRSLLNIEWWYALARLAPDVPRGAAERELGALLRRAVDDAPDGTTTLATLDANGIRPVVTDLKTWQTSGASDFVLLLVLAVALLFLLAVGAVANLLVHRHEARAGDLRIRRLLGATNAHLFTHLVGEPLTLAVPAGMLGAAGAWGATNMIVAADALTLPRVDVTWLPAAAAGAAMVLAAVLVPLLGLLSLSWVRRERGHLGGLRVTAWTGTRRTLLGIQLAASTVLLVAALALGSSLQALARQPLGFEIENMLTFQVALPEPAYADTIRARAFHRTVLEGVRALPGVASAGHADGLPSPAMRWGGAMVEVEGFDDADVRPTYWWGHISDGFLETLGVPLRAGRHFTPGEVETSAPVAVVNETLADLHWGDADQALGRRLGRGGRTALLEVVGVVASTAGDGTGSEPVPLVYVPRGRAVWGDLSGGVYVIRTTRPPVGLAAAVRGIVAEAEPTVPVYDVATMETRVARASARERMALQGTGVAGLASVVVVMVSIAGLLLVTIAQRRREIGIRKAVGATDGGLQLFLVRGVVVPAAVGIGIGAAAVVWGVQVPSSLLHGGVEGHTWLPATAAGLALIVVVVGLAAPHRLAAILPAEALRYE